MRSARSFRKRGHSAAAQGSATGTLALEAMSAGVKGKASISRETSATVWPFREDSCPAMVLRAGHEGA